MNFVLLLSLVAVSTAAEFKIRNNAQGPIWIGILGNNGKPPLENGGFILEQGQEKVVYSDDVWAGRFWARTWCNYDSNHCQTGDCGDKVECNGAGGVPPASLVEINLDGDLGNNFYDISLVDGFNLPASITPEGGSGDCRQLSCSVDINQRCPKDLQVKEQDSGQVIGCNSACNRYNTDQYCCRGAYDKRETCKTEDWASNSARIFKDACPDAYSYAYDDNTSLYTCKSQAYTITFG